MDALIHRWFFKKWKALFWFMYMKTMKDVFSSPHSYLYSLWCEQVHSRFASFVAHWFRLSEQVLRVSQSCSCFDATHAVTYHHFFKLRNKLKHWSWAAERVFTDRKCSSLPCHIKTCAIVHCRQLFLCTQKQATHCFGIHWVHLSACHVWNMWNLFLLHKSKQHVVLERLCVFYASLRCASRCQHEVKRLS